MRQWEKRYLQQKIVNGKILIYTGHLEKQKKKYFNSKGRKRTVHQRANTNDAKTSFKMFIFPIVLKMHFKQHRDAL